MRRTGRIRFAIRAKIEGLSMLTFNVGDCVRWHREVSTPDGRQRTGVIREVFSNAEGTDELSLFVVEFGFGFRNLRGSQLDRVRDVRGVPA